MKLIYLLLVIYNVQANVGVHKVDSLKLTNNYQIKPLYRLIEGAKVVGIGESAHGSKGFLDARAKIIKGLVEDEGYRLLLLEDGFRTVDTINDYLMFCKNSTGNSLKLIKAIKSLSSIYINESTKKLVSWLCTFNRTAKVPVRFHGIDQWEKPWVTRTIIKKGIELTRDIKFKDLYETAQKNCFAWNIDDWSEGSWDYLFATWNLGLEEHRKCSGSLYNLKRLMRKHSSIDKDEFFQIVMALEVAYVYEAYRDLFVHDSSRALNLRDQLQATLVTMWMNKYNNKLKAILLAHNIHISKNQSTVIPPRPSSTFRWINVRSTGENLIAHYGTGYKSVAISGYKISSSRDGDYKTIDTPDALDYILSRFGDYLIVDPNIYWIRDKKWWMHEEFNGMYLSPNKQYDAIFYVKESKAAKSL